MTKTLKNATAVYCHNKRDKKTIKIYLSKTLQSKKKITKTTQ